MIIDLKVFVWGLHKTVLRCKVICPRWVCERKAIIRESSYIIDLGRVGYIRYVLYQSVVVEVLSSLSRHVEIPILGNSFFVDYCFLFVDFFVRHI